MFLKDIDQRFLLDSSGGSWRLAQGYLPIHEVRDFVKEGMHYYVQYCESDTAERGRLERLQRDYLSHLVSAEEHERLLTKLKAPTVMVAELWRNSHGEQLILIREL